MKKTIFAIDDSKAIRFLLHTILGKEYQVISMADHCSAMYWLSRNNLPDLIIVDPQLPDTHDWELIKYFASTGIFRNVPLLVLSGLNTRETRLKCEEYGVNKFFMKPFDPIDVVNIVNTLMKKQPFSHEYFNAN